MNNTSDQYTTINKTNQTGRDNRKIQRQKGMNITFLIN